MRNIYYPSALFHKAIKRNKPKFVYYRYDFWFHTQKSVIVYSPLHSHQREVMLMWLKNQNIEVIYETER